MESHGGRSLETPRGVAPEERCPPDGTDSFRRLDAPRRSNCPARVHSRPQMAIVTAPPPQTCALQPITSSGPIRTSNLSRYVSRSTSSAGHRTHPADSRINLSTGGRLESSAAPQTPVLNGRTHSSRAQNSNQLSNTLTNSAGRSRSVASSVEIVSLTLPRPETERVANEYVETPLRSDLSLIEPKLEPRILRTSSGVSSGESVQRDSNFAMVTLPVTGLDRKQEERGGEKKVVTSQPSATFKKARYHPETQCSRQSDDIICSECKRCRCESCRTPRPLPSKWICGTCHCSAESVVDYATCLCCAKAFFYHCSNDEAVSNENDPCSCSPDMFYARWGCLGLMSCFLPCLLCYWPFRGIVQICESCHRYYSSQGCRCQKPYQQPAPLTFEKRLLDSPE